MFRKSLLVLVITVLAFSGMIASAKLDPAQVEPFLGNWALSLPGGGAGWMSVTFENGWIDSEVLWGGGSVIPASNVMLEDGSLIVYRAQEIERRDASRKVVRRHLGGQVIIAKVNGDAMNLTTMYTKPDQTGWTEPQQFTGKRIPPVPAAPDLSQVKYGDPIQLLNGKDLTGWRLTDANQANGWKVENGVLINDPVQPEGKHISYGNLRTDQEFEDFTLTTEVMVPKGGNSGIYLRGIYEVQVADTYGRPLDSHNMGGLYSRITPSQSAEKPAGEWQTYKITLCDRHLTVVLNGITIIDNQPVLGVTGGALTADEFKPGPIYLQGDHTVAHYRNMVLTPILK